MEIVQDDFRDDLYGGYRACKTDFPGEQKADEKRVDRSGNAPADGLEDGPRVRLALRKKSHE
jgi:hypothetical protein